MKRGQLRDCRPILGRYSAPAPHVQPLRRQFETTAHNLWSNRVYKRAIRVSVTSHTDCIHSGCIDDKGHSCMEIHIPELPIDLMIDVAGRLRERIDTLGISQAEIARRADITPQRLNNYLQRKGNLPDVETLAKLARILGVSIDWLCGLNADGPIDYEPIISRFLELAGMDPAFARDLAAAVLEAGRIAAALPDEGSAALRSRLAAQTVWHSRGGLKPS